MRYGVSMLQVVRVHPEPVEGRFAVKLLGGWRGTLLPTVVVRQAHQERFLGYCR